jgi:hypothetical protein
MRIRRSVLTVVVLGLVAAACSGGGEADMNVTLRDDGITLSPDSVTAGDLTLESTNEGTKIHEFEVFAVPDGVDANALPVEGDTAPADEMLEVIDGWRTSRPARRRPSASRSSGSYAAIVTPDHYANGMHATFTVE